MSIVNKLINTSFNMYSDATGPDPDSSSPTLCKYHQILWSKKLPNGEFFDLKIKYKDSKYNLLTIRLQVNFH